MIDKLEAALAAGAHLRVKDWAKHFENHRSRELKTMNWVAVPNSFDGLKFIDLITHPNGLAHFGAWILILELASKCNPRGTLVRDCGSAFFPRDIAVISRSSAEILREAAERLVFSLGWLELIENNQQPREVAGIPRSSATIPREAAGKRSLQEGNRRGEQDRQPVSPLATPTQPERDVPDLSEAFAELWDAYPKKGRTKRVACEQYYVGIMEGLAGEALNRRINLVLNPVLAGGAWAESAKWAAGYVQNLDTYLAQRQWDEEPEAAGDAMIAGMTERERAIKRQQEIDDSWARP